MLGFFARMFGLVGRWFGGVFTAQLGMEIVKWTAFKILMLSIWTVGGYILVFNIIGNLAGKILTDLSGLMTGAYGASMAANPYVLELTGFAAWLAQVMHLPDSFAVIVTGYICRATRQFLPFGR